MLQSFDNEVRIGKKILKQQQPRKRFLRVMWKAGSKDHVGKNQARAERIRKFAFFVKRKVDIKRYKNTRSFDAMR